MSSSVKLLDEVISTFETKQEENSDSDSEEDNGSIYPRTLIRQYSGDLDISANNDDNNLTYSLSFDDDDETKYENMTDIVKEQLSTKPYAKINRNMDGIAKKSINLICGYTRMYYKGTGSQIMPSAVVGVICNFYPDIHFFCWNDLYISLESSEDENPNIFILLKKHCVLSNFLKPFIENRATEIVKIQKVKCDILELIVTYLCHHNGLKPEEIAKPIRSVKMERIVSDKWDADYINKMDKKTIFQVILGANYLDLPSLLHLGCAKIATLIKGKSPEEIRNILADDSNDNKDENKQENKENVVDDSNDKVNENDIEKNEQEIQDKDVSNDVVDVDMNGDKGNGGNIMVSDEVGNENDNEQEQCK